jgi:hypothetical protein
MKEGENRENSFMKHIFTIIGASRAWLWNGMEREREKDAIQLFAFHTAHFFNIFFERKINVTISHKNTPRRIVKFYFRTFFSSAAISLSIIQLWMQKGLLLLLTLSPPIHHMTNILVCRCEVISLQRSIQCSWKECANVCKKIATFFPS